MRIGNYYSTNNRKIQVALNLIDSIWKNKKNCFKFNTTRKLSILIVRVEHLGDILSSLSIVNGIHQLAPDTQIDLLVAKHSEFLISGLNSFNEIFMIPSTIFHDKSKKSIFKKISLTLIAYYRAFKIISRKKYDCVIFASHHFFGMQLLGIFAKNSLAYSSVGFSALHSCKTKIKYNFQVHDRAKIMLEKLFPKINQLKNIDLSYEKIKFQIEDLKISGNYLVLAVATGNKEKDIDVSEILLNDEISILLKSISKVFLVGDIPSNNSLDEIIKAFTCNVIYVGKNYSINKLSNLICSAKGIISADTFLAHLSAAVTNENPIFIFYKKEIGFDQWKPPGKNVKQIFIG
mgnify:CR=1 FL=1|tara:strand:+ start:806 stop:1846 length:1041 start_codon:yes stop_codon:yes gene_type:complete